MRVAVVITFYRNDAFFPEALASVLAQTRPADEIVVVDDASPAGEATTLEHLGQPVSVIRHRQNRGAGAARQSGTEATTAPLLAYLDGDDVWLPDKLDRQLDFLRVHSDYAAIHAALIEFRDDGSERLFNAKPASIDLTEALRMHHVMPSSLLIRRDALDGVGGWSSARPLTEDQDLVIRLAAAGHRIGFQDEPLVRFRRFDHDNLSSQRWQQMRSNLAVIRRHYRVYLQELGFKETLAIGGRHLAGLGRDGGTSGRLARMAGWLLGHRELR